MGFCKQIPGGNLFCYAGSCNHHSQTENPNFSEYKKVDSVHQK